MANTGTVPCRGDDILGIDDDGHQLLMAKSQSDGKKGHGWGYDSFLLMSLRPVGTEKYRNLLLYSQVL